jgi:DNA repair exonuclease SbcCD nuclease subunit
MSFIIVGDPHLDKGTSIGKVVDNSLNSRIQDKFNLLDWVLKKAIFYSVKDIFITGDLCESFKPDYLVLYKFLQNFAAKATDAGINIHLILGNHDIRRIGKDYFSSLFLMEFSNLNIKIYNSICSTEIDNTNIIIIPFKDKRSYNVEKTSEALDLLNQEIKNEYKPSKKNVVIGHLTLEESLYIGDEVDDEHNELICPLSMFEDYNFTWMGHIHKPQVLNKYPHMAHVGSLDISDFGEVNQEKHIVVFDNNHPDNFFHLETPTRSLFHIEIFLPKDLDYKAFLNEEIEKFAQSNRLTDSIVKITVSPEDPEAILDKKEIESTLLKFGVYNVCDIVIHKVRTTVLLEKKSNLKVDSSLSTAYSAWLEKKGINKDLIPKILSKIKEVEQEIV